MRPVGRQRILGDQKAPPREGLAEVVEQALDRLPLAVVLRRPVRVGDRLEGQHQRLALLVRVYDRGGHRLVGVLGDGPLGAFLHQAVRAADLRRAEAARAVDRQHVASVEADEFLQRLAALQIAVQRLERRTQRLGRHLVEDFAHLRVRGHRALAVEAFQVVDQPRVGMRLGVELQHRAELQVEHRECGAQGVAHRMGYRALAARVGHRSETLPQRADQTGGGQTASESGGGSGHGQRTGTRRRHRRYRTKSSATCRTQPVVPSAVLSWPGSAGARPHLRDEAMHLPGMVAEPVRADLGIALAERLSDLRQGAAGRHVDRPEDSAVAPRDGVGDLSLAVALHPDDPGAVTAGSRLGHRGPTGRVGVIPRRANSQVRHWGYRHPFLIHQTRCTLKCN